MLFLLFTKVNFISFPKIVRKYEMKEAEYLRTIFEEEQEMCNIAHRIVCLSHDTSVLLQDVYHIDKNK